MCTKITVNLPKDNLTGLTKDFTALTPEYKKEVLKTAVRLLEIQKDTDVLSAQIKNRRTK